MKESHAAYPEMSGMGSCWHTYATGLRPVQLIVSCSSGQEVCSTLLRLISWNRISNVFVSTVCDFLATIAIRLRWFVQLLQHITGIEKGL